MNRDRDIACDPVDDRTPFERFADLARKLFNVPKAETDALEAERPRRKHQPAKPK